MPVQKIRCLGVIGFLFECDFYTIFGAVHFQEESRKPIYSPSIDLSLPFTSEKMQRLMKANSHLFRNDSFKDMDYPFEVRERREREKRRERVREGGTETEGDGEREREEGEYRG